MPVDKQIVGDFATEIYSLGSLTEHFEIYEKYVQKLGFEGVAYTFMPEFSLEKNIQQAPVFISSELFPISFIEQYAHDRFEKNDFSVRRIKAKQLTPMDWNKFRLSNKLTQKEKDVLLVANREHGISNGITIPTMSEEMGIAGASIVSRTNDSDFQKLKKERLETLQICTKLFHDATVNLSDSSLADKFVIPLLITMKPKEILILRYFLSGKPLKNISDTTDISYSYATNLLGDLRHKLGGISNEKLMYIMGLFKILDQL